jgi:drug/metabolite transporter (DMT)-like permease
MINEVLLIASETILSAYPLLIKLADVTVVFQTGLRMIIFAVLATLGAQATGSPLAASTLFSAESIAVGLLNLLHVGSSYTAFDQLAGGNAMALFYTYPVWNILGAAAVLGESIPGASIPWIGVALIGAILLAKPSAMQWTAVGVVAALTAALTETGIYLWFRKHEKPEEETQPWTKMIQMYGSSALFWLIGVIVFGAGAAAFKASGKDLLGILLFNGLVGFLGYALRFYLIPKVSTVAFSALSFFGIVSAYGLSWMFADEVPTLVQGLGALAIIVANTVLVNKQTV